MPTQRFDLTLSEEFICDNSPGSNYADSGFNSAWRGEVSPNSPPETFELYFNTPESPTFDFEVYGRGWNSDPAYPNNVDTPFADWTFFFDPANLRLDVTWQDVNVVGVGCDSITAHGNELWLLEGELCQSYTALAHYTPPPPPPPAIVCEFVPLLPLPPKPPRPHFPKAPKAKLPPVAKSAMPPARPFLDLPPRRVLIGHKVCTNAAGLEISREPIYRFPKPRKKRI